MFQTEYIPTVGKLHDLICTGTGVWFGNSVSHICTQVRQRCVSSCDCRVGRLHIPTTWMATWPGQEDRNSLGVASSETCETWSLTGPTPRTCLEFPFRNSHTDHTGFCLGFQFFGVILTVFQGVSKRFQSGSHRWFHIFTSWPCASPNKSRQQWRDAEILQPKLPQNTVVDISHGSFQRNRLHFFLWDQFLNTIVDIADPTSCFTYQQELLCSTGIYIYTHFYQVISLKDWSPCPSQSSTEMGR